MFYFYVLLSEKDKKYYYGSAKDLQKRFCEHKLGNITATKHRRPLRLMYYKAYETERLARNREKQVKSSGSVRQSILKRINLGS
jgi:putative endonuclease